MHDVATTTAHRRRAIRGDVFTTGQIAQICAVSSGTVSKWIDSGLLWGYRIPGRKDRRVPRTELIRFMRQYGIPLSGFFNGVIPIMVIDQFPDGIAVLRKQCGERLEILATSSIGSAAVLIERRHPRVVFVDGYYKGVAAELFCLVKDHPELQPTSLYEIRRPEIRWDFALDGFVEHPLDRSQIKNVLFGLDLL